ncbi:hypothetical protein A2V68_02155 [candidate division Kazan bacterium RBG_13_50_9]|uniref:Uncharacterized protein n=1 Tax=candidate division Kazan bacterium RBG_13_50_9 TaxID=1798535 RepID=A0A1F4NRJ1_UNCK3|nr:MAG: hypothetical protein A2V68_02155 [candidate division Kazan bacterium RBG_13_50_9]
MVSVSFDNYRGVIQLMPETPKFVREHLDTIVQEPGPDGKLPIFDPEEFLAEELGWVHSKAGKLLGYVLHKLAISLPPVGSRVFSKSHGVCEVVGAAGYAMTLSTRDREIEVSTDASTKITSFLLLGWNKPHILAAFVPGDPRWSGLIDAIRLQTLANESRLEGLAVYEVVDSCAKLEQFEPVAPTGGKYESKAQLLDDFARFEAMKAYYWIHFQLGIYPLLDKWADQCMVAVMPDFQLAKGLFAGEPTTRLYRLEGLLEGAALVNPISRKVAVKLRGPDDFFWDSTAP